MWPTDRHLKLEMTQQQQSVDIQQERLAAEPPEKTPGNIPASSRENPGGESWGNDHAVNIRLSIPLLFSRYYVTIVAGKERRSRERQASERQKHPVLKQGNLVFAAGCGLVIGLAMLSLFQLATAHVLQQLGVMVLP